MMQNKLYPDLDLTNFPQEVDNFTRFLDITAQDGPLVAQYTQAMNEGNSVLANEILARIPSVTAKLVRAVDLNKLTQAVLAIERFYKSDMKPYISDKQVEWDNKIDQFTYQGDWNANAPYQKNNLVTMVRLGIKYLYIAIKNVPAGFSPNNSEYWRVITIQGEQGISGQGLAYREQWVAAEQYSVNDAVTYNGALWVATKPSRGVTPTQDSNSWKIVMSLAVTAYPIQSIEPEAQEAGDLWFNTQGNPTKFYFLETLNNPAKASDIARGKEAYDSEGNRIVGTGFGGRASVNWNSPDNTGVNWNGPNTISFDWN